MRLSDLQEKIIRSVFSSEDEKAIIDFWNSSEGKPINKRIQGLIDFFKQGLPEKDHKTVELDIMASFSDSFGRFDPKLVTDDTVEEIIDMYLDFNIIKQRLDAEAGGGGGAGGGGAAGGTGGATGGTSGGDGGGTSSGGDGGSADSGGTSDSGTTSSDSTSSDAPVSRGFYGIGTMAPYKKSKKKKKKKKAGYDFGGSIYEAIREVETCPKTKSKGCQCERLQKISEAEQTVKAIATLEHTEGDVQGAIKFKQKPGQPTIIKGIVKGLTPGKHGFHIHEFGDLSKGCESAGAHYDPEGVEHGSLEQGHVGDLGNIIADKSGTARFQIKAQRVELSDVVGRAIVIHADEDDLGKGGDEESLKTGNAGERVGCGVIRLREVVEEKYNRKVSDKHFFRHELPQIRRADIQNSPFTYKEGKISIDNIKPVQSQRVKGLSKKAEDVFLKNEDRPFILDKKGYLINGHHRLDAANVLGINKVPAIMIDANIEEVMDHFEHTTSDRAVMAENYRLKFLLQKHLSDKKFINEMKAVHEGDVPRLKPRTSGTKYPLFSKENAQKAYEEWYNGAPVDTDIKIVGNDNKLYIIRQNTDGDSQHFKDDDWYLTDADYKPVDFQGYEDPGELLFSHSATGYEPIDPHDLDENFADGKVKGKSRPGRVKRSGASCKGSVTSLRKKAKDSSGEKSKMYHWCANMKSGRKKS